MDSKEDHKAHKAKKGEPPSRDREENAWIEKTLVSLKWEHYALVGLILACFIFYGVYISSYTQLPSPVYGGDLYRDRGFVQSIVAGSPFWEDAYYLHEYQYYGYLVPMVQAGIVMLTGADVDRIFLFFPLITMVLSTVVWFLFGSKLFNSERMGLLTAAAFLALDFSIYPSLGTVPAFLMLPAFLYFWLRYEEEGSFALSLLAGLFLGLACLAYPARYVSGMGMLAFGLVLFFIRDLMKRKLKGWKEVLSLALEYLKKYWGLVLVALIFAAIYFLPFQIIYGMEIVNNVPEWGDLKLEELGPGWMLGIAKQVFFNFSNPFLGIAGLVCLAGFLSIIFSKKTKKTFFILSAMLASFAIIQHQLVTEPLIGWSFWPIKLVYLSHVYILSFAFGIWTFSQLSPAKYRRFIYGGAFILLFIVFYVKFGLYSGGYWEATGHGDTAHLSALSGLASFIRDNVSLDEAILSNDESGFMLAVLSGRKVMLTRRTHASYFVDIDRRIADAAVAMYGGDINKSLEILAKYHVKYLYVDSYLFQYPMRVRPDLVSYLEENGVNFTKVHDRYDIAVPLEQAVTMDLLIIPPQEMNPDFMPLWEQAYPVVFNGQAISALLRLKE